MGKKTTKDQTTPTLQTLSEIDCDLLEQLDMEDEGQVLPMRDPPQTTASSSQDTLTPLGQLIDEHPGPMPSLEAPPRDPSSRK
jgi:hypothetical protein